MRGIYFFSAAAAALLSNAAIAGNGTNIIDGTEPEKLDSVVVSASRAGKHTPVTFTMTGREELRSANPINSLPMVLSLQPSVVTYNEGGTGLGNSSMTVRGSKGSQINVTLNGITLNDSESQEVFWVNIPSLTSLISSVQLQRGLGTSANGAGAFGASVNMSTASVSPEPAAAIEFSTGSWNTRMTSLAVGTGVGRSGMYFNLAYSKGDTDGYIRNAGVSSRSLFAVLGWMNEKNSLRLTYLMGDQKSGITWDGIDLEQYEKDRRYNGAGEYYDELGNVHYYGNQTDNYRQHHLQLNYTRQFTAGLSWSSTLNYTRGDGYDEYYKVGKTLADYGLDMGGDSDLTYRKKMGNDYYVFNTDLRYRTEKMNITAGANISRYNGDHFGEILWVKELKDGYDFSDFNAAGGWYSNASVKKEYTAFVRAEYTPLEWLTAYADIQGRFLDLDMEGADDDAHETGLGIAYSKNWNFFNPRAGLTFHWAQGQKAYASAAFGHREPGRGDIKENIKGELNPISPEKMLDVEVGYEYVSEKLSLSANVYLMEYWDMLLETGKLSSSGYAIKENVNRSWRRGLELGGVWSPKPWLRVDANLALSTNKIKDYTSYVEVWDGAKGETKAFNYGTATMLMSPSVNGMAKVSVSPWALRRNSLKNTTFSLSGKYVGKQFLDNTGRDAMAVPAYFVSDLTVSHEFALRGCFLGISGYVNNVFNHLYYAAGWRWEGYTKETDTLEYGIGVYPQAPVNYMVKMSLRF